MLIKSQLITRLLFGHTADDPSTIFNFNCGNEHDQTSYWPAIEAYLHVGLLQRQDQAAGPLLYVIVNSEILGVERTADQAQIKKAYYKLAQQYHPDKNPAQDAKEKFTEIAG